MAHMLPLLSAYLILEKKFIPFTAWLWKQHWETFLAYCKDMIKNLLSRNFGYVTEKLIFQLNMIFFASNCWCPVKQLFRVHRLTRGQLRAFRQGEVLQHIQNFREKFWSKFWISLYVLYIFTSPSDQNTENSASLGSLFLPNRLLGWALV